MTLASFGPVAVLVPVKSFGEAKLRLAPALPPEARAGLARSMAERVLRAAGDLPATVVCEDEQVAIWAESQGASVVWAPGLGLNGAVKLGVDSLGDRGFPQVIVAHADLPRAGHLGWVGRFAGVTLVPDHNDNGTNVICVPGDAGFTFSYGPGSFARHGAEARRLGLPLRVVREPSLSHDVDLPADLVAFRALVS